MIVGNPFTGLGAGSITWKAAPMKLDYVQLMGVGLQIAAALGTAFEQWSAGGDVVVPPIRTYLGGKHLEIDLTVKHLP